MTLTKTPIKTVTYAYKDGFFVDVQECDETFDIYLYHETKGGKDLLFGLPKESYDNEEMMLESIENQLDEYVKQFIEDYFD